MPSETLVFVDVDTQRDFIEPDGTLAIAGAGTIVANLARLTAVARDRGIPVLATACWHDADDPEMALFDPHCLADTPGAQRAEATARPDTRVLGHNDRHDGAIVPHLTIHKRSFDVFDRPDVATIVDRYNLHRPTFVVYGVATDYCVRCAVLGLLDRGCNVAVVVDAIRAVNPAAEADVLTDFARRGAVLTLTDHACKSEGWPADAALA